MSKKEEQKLIPTLRFPEFRDTGAWKPKQLGQVADIVTGSTPQTSDYSNYGGDIMFVSPVDISEERYIVKTKTTLTHKGYSKTRAIKANSVLFVCIGSTIGKVAQNKFDCATNQQINALIPYNNYLSDFLYFALEKDSKKIASFAGHQAVPIINKSNFSSMFVNFPTQKEQQKITDCLTSIDTLITIQVGKVKALKAHKKGLIQYLFPGEGETVPKLRFHEFKDKGEWEERKLKDLVTTLSPPKKLPTVDYLTNGKYPIIDQSQEYICGWTNDSDAVITESLPLIIFGDHTCILKLATMPFVQGADGIKILKPNNLVETSYLYQALQFKPIIMESYKRHFSALKEKKVVFPPKDSGEQQKVADCLMSIDDLITTHTKKVEALKNYKRGMMQQLFPSSEDNVL